MTTRIIRITACAQCPHALPFIVDEGDFFECERTCGECPPTGTPDWCPLEKLEEGK